MLFRKARAAQGDEAVHAAFGSTALNTAQAQEDHSMSDPGPQNLGLVRLSPNSNRLPPTDQGSVGSIWHSFDRTHRRVQEGGWSHQVTQHEIPLLRTSRV
jgi:oxalate decarboxylase